MSANANDEQVLVEWLRGRDASCPVCGYNVRSLEAPRCPECAAELRLGVEAANAVWGPWAFASLSLALALGFDAVTTIIITTGYLLMPPPPVGRTGVWWLMGIFGGLSLACALGLWRVLARRRTWMRLPKARQWRSAGLVFAAVAGVHTAFGALVLSYLW